MLSNFNARDERRNLIRLQLAIGADNIIVNCIQAHQNRQDTDQVDDGGHTTGHEGNQPFGLADIEEVLDHGDMAEI